MNYHGAIYLATIITVISLNLGLGFNSALATTRINFSRGSYCGFYSGEDNQYILQLGKGQTFVIEGNLFWSIEVRSSRGRVLQPNNINREGNLLTKAEYFIPSAGDYIVSISIPSEWAEVKFCAF